MPLNRSDYLNNTDDQISAQKRMEKEGPGIGTALVWAGGIAGLMLLRKKAALLTAFSSEVKAVGKLSVSGGLIKSYGSLEKYILKKPLPRFFPNPFKWAKSVPGLIKAPLPTASEQLGLATRHLNLYNRFKTTGLPISSREAGIAGWNKWHTFFKGPAVAAIAPGTRIGERVVGEHGALTVGKTLHEIGKKEIIKKTRSGVAETISTGTILRSTEGIEVGAVGSIGHKIETHLGKGYKGFFEAKHPTSFRRFVRQTLLPGKERLIEEEKRLGLLTLARTKGFGVTPKMESFSFKELQDKLVEMARSSGLDADFPIDFYRRNYRDIMRSYAKTVESLVTERMKKPGSKIAYNLYNLQKKAGVGEMYAAKGMGYPAWIERQVRAIAGAGARHPESGALLGYRAQEGLIKSVFGLPGKVPDPRSYVPYGASISGLWKSKRFLPKTGGFYIRKGGKTVERTAMGLLEGTFFTIPEDIFGIGITARGIGPTRALSRALGLKTDSIGSYFWNRYVGGVARVVGAASAAYYGYNFINYLARQTTGWGPTDVTAKAYTSAREFQQHSLDFLGVVNAAKTTETAFPGTINSPLARFARYSSPLWMGGIGHKVAGAKGGKIGLAMGIAMALLTWGDITQSPEELHRIYTGEQDVPIRKGRYWIFGQTPFFGGKTSYWRQHWYPLLKSKYKFQGQPWESETEYWAQGTPFAPILAPLLTGEMWDPYYWEKKHYRDRPYPVTGELFEPTSPFAAILNPMLGELIKPQRLMHPEYFGTPQPEPMTARGTAVGTGAELGVGEYRSFGQQPMISPESLAWRGTQAIYSTTEMMGLRGFAVQNIAEALTGRPDILPRGPVLQSARRATGLERAYWEREFGDPFGITEFFRRILPHRRRAIEEYNPIRNQMPDWMPGENYYIDFRSGDPYIKVPMGEARLPGPGYNALNQLHSEIPGVYDAVDRFLILSDVAPYSDEYKHYRYLAKAMVRKEGEESYWAREIQEHLEQREETMREFDFLELEPPEDVPAGLRGPSALYRHGVAAITGFPNPLEAIPFIPFGTAGKIFPYKTAEATYRDYRLYGDIFKSWAHPLSAFVYPYMKKTTGWATDLVGGQYIPESEEERREYEEYFDRLKYVKFKNLEQMADDQHNASLARKYRSLADKTTVGVDPHVDISRLYGAMPKRERDFLEAFINTKRKDREEILDMVPRQMERIYKAQWNMKDRSEGLPEQYDVGKTTSRDMVEYFKSYNLPKANWTGWHPDVELKNVQLKVVKREAMDIHRFNLWESRERAMERRPYVPTIPDIKEPTIDLSVLQNALREQLQVEGLSNPRINITRTASVGDRVNINFKVKKNKKNRIDNYMRSFSYA